VLEFATTNMHGWVAFSFEFSSYSLLSTMVFPQFFSLSKFPNSFPILKILFSFIFFGQKQFCFLNTLPSA